MKKLLLLLTGLILLGLTSCKKEPAVIELPEQTETEASITLTISNIVEFEGKLHLGLYNSQEAWELDIENRQAANVFRLERPDVTQENQQIVFEKLPAGEYGFSIYQDVNESGSMDLDAILNLIPQEPYGFSNNFVPVLSPPNFENVRFTLEKDQALELEVSLIQP